VSPLASPKTIFDPFSMETLSPRSAQLAYDRHSSPTAPYNDLQDQFSPAPSIGFSFASPVGGLSKCTCQLYFAKVVQQCPTCGGIREGTQEAKSKTEIDQERQRQIQQQIELLRQPFYGNKQ